ncbi:F-box domain-containing protein [Aulographum hederae CBS 113979]|uniref:F-box domain-containing protein n=1 Tax=Aulographum hederae CBS 113979 TaxID=1176131 RepID=A0A6G1GP87_9PEZI|nr:F-box domain-containing protein [Aulographum hederae CBS 113979]
MQPPLLTLPNELLLTILSTFHTHDILPLTLISHRLHALVLRILHTRLLLAANLHEHTLLLECYHPSARLTEPPLYCTYLGTAGLDVGAGASKQWDESKCAIGQLGKMKNLYSSFRPHRRLPDGPRPRHPAGDIPGSRTHVSSAAASSSTAARFDGVTVKQTLSLESHELFTQLCADSNLVRVGPRNGLFTSFVQVEEGVVRVWRDWLAQMAGLEGETSIDGFSQSEQVLVDDVGRNRHILWVDTLKNVGINVRVKERKWRRDTPILMEANEDDAVSYDIEYEELLVRTSTLMMKLEESLLHDDNHSGKAIVFGSFS